VGRQLFIRLLMGYHRHIIETTYEGNYGYNIQIDNTEFFDFGLYVIRVTCFDNNENFLDDSFSFTISPISTISYTYCLADGRMILRTAALITRNYR